jgi:predicted aldo/keto reductase-like oxidoreductase
MLYRKNPKNGDELSILGFGCMRLPMKEDGTIDEERATSQVRYAIDHGVNYVDTAWPYHMEQSEPFLGRALADGYREKVKLATKLPSWMVKSREDMDHFLNFQLEKLKSDHIDYYLIHALVGALWDNVEKLGVADFLDKAKADGRIINAGFSFHGAGEDFKRIVDAYDWDFCQIQYNFLDGKNQAGTKGLEYAASKGLGVIIMEPLRGGMLASHVPPSVKEIWDEAPTKRTAAGWALRWVWNHPEVTVVLSGMNEETHIVENLTVADRAYPNSLTEAELQLVKRAERKYRELMKAGCTGCRYCMPCPEGVDIPVCFELNNGLHMSGNADEAKFLYAAMLSGVLSAGKPKFASQCVQCGKCLEKCPQHLDIPTILESVVEELEGPDLVKRVAAAKQVFLEKEVNY